MSSATEGARGNGLVGAGLLLLGLAGCQPAAPPEPTGTAGIVRASPAEARARAAAVLRAAGFAATEFEGSAAPTLRGELAAGSDPGWAHGPGIWTSDPFGDLGRSRFVEAEGRRAVVVVRTSALPQGTSVEVDLHVIGLYRRAFTGDRVEAHFGSSAVLEQRILDAAAGIG